MERSTPDITPTAEPTQEPTQMETPIEQQHLYDLNPGYVKIELEANENLFGMKIEGSMVKDDKIGWETIYNDDVNKIFERESYTPRNFDLYSELQPEQARAIETEYGNMVSLTMEQIDTDSDGALDKVAVRYEGSKTWTFEDDYKQGWTAADYISENI